MGQSDPERQHQAGLILNWDSRSAIPACHVLKRSTFTMSAQCPLVLQLRKYRLLQASKRTILDFLHHIKTASVFADTGQHTRSLAAP